MSTERLGIAVALLVCAAGCGGSSSSTTDAGIDAGQATGTLSLSFTVANGVRQSPNLHQALRGPIYGGIFHNEDVSVGGPIGDAGSVADVNLPDVDLTDADAGPVAVSWTSPALPPGEYTFLGYMDVNRDAGSSDPSTGDPVTLPTTNKANVTAGTETPLKVEFNLVYN